MQPATNGSTSPSPLRAWLSAKDVATRYGVSIPTVWNWAKNGRLPQPHKLAENTTRWRLSELEAHDEAEATRRGAYEPKSKPARRGTA